MTVREITFHQAACDSPTCWNETEAYESADELALDAALDGWVFTELDDYCPEHAQKGGNVYEHLS